MTATKSRTWLVGIFPHTNGKTDFHNPKEVLRFNTEDEAYSFEKEYNNKNFYGTPVKQDSEYAFLYALEEN